MACLRCGGEMAHAFSGLSAWSSLLFLVSFDSVGRLPDRLGKPILAAVLQWYDDFPDLILWPRPLQIRRQVR
mgnify:CR=1 FL=1